MGSFSSQNFAVPSPKLSISSTVQRSFPIKRILSFKWDRFRRKTSLYRRRSGRRRRRYSAVFRVKRILSFKCTFSYENFAEPSPKRSISSTVQWTFPSKRILSFEWINFPRKTSLYRRRSGRFLRRYSEVFRVKRILPFKWNHFHPKTSLYRRRSGRFRAWYSEVCWVNRILSF